MAQIPQGNFTLTDLKQSVGYTVDGKTTGTSNAGFKDMRVIVGDNGQPIKAPTSFKNRAFAWIKTNVFGSAERFGGVQNQQTQNLQNSNFKRSVFNVLARSEGREIANQAFARILGGNWSGPGNNARPLNTYQVRQILHEAEKLRLEARSGNTESTKNFLNGPGWQQALRDHNLDSQIINDSGFREAFTKAIARHPQFSQHRFTQQELAQIAGDAIQSHQRECLEKVRREFPNLSTQIVPFSPHIGTYIGNLKAMFQPAPNPMQQPGAYFAEPQPFRDGCTAALTSIDQARQAIAKMSFRIEVGGNQQAGTANAIVRELNQCRLDLVQRHTDLTNVNPNTLSPQAQAFRTAMLNELTHQIAAVDGKLRSMQAFLQSDPFSDKSVYRPRMVWAQAVFNEGQRAWDALQEKIDQVAQRRQQMAQNPNTPLLGYQRLNAYEARLLNAQNQLRHNLDQWFQQEQNDYTQLQDGHRSFTPQQVKDGVNPQPPGRPFALPKNWARDQIRDIAVQSGFSRREVNELFSSDTLKQARLDVLHEPPNWQVTLRDMTVTKGGVTQTYRETQKPISVSGNINQRHMAQLGIGGLVPEARGVGTAPINARTTTIHKVDDNGHIVGHDPLHERQQHAIVDHWKLPDPRRDQQNQASFMMLLTEAVTSDATFAQQLVNDSLGGHNPPPRKLYYINSNETSPAVLNKLRPGDHDELEYSERQSRAMSSLNGVQQFAIDDPSQPLNPFSQDIQVRADVEIIDFKFPVNGSIGNPLGGWKGLGDHNRGELSKLVGGLTSGERIEGAMGDTIRELERIANDPNANPAHREEAKKFLQGLQENVDELRHMMREETYKKAPEGDRFKGPRTVDIAVNLWRRASNFTSATLHGGDRQTRIISAGNCMSAKDREGNTCCECQGQTMIEDLGGKIKPGEDLSAEDRQINNIALSGVVNNTMRVTTYGGSKNAEEHSVRIGDHESIEYIYGTSKKAKT
jgi:hypothetical protein